MYIRKPEISFITRVKNFFECLFCKHKKDCPVSFGNRITIHYSMPGEFSSDFYHKNLCEKEDRPYRYGIYKERAETIILMSICFLIVIFAVTGVAGVITKNKILLICSLIGIGIDMILSVIWYKITK